MWVKVKVEGKVYYDFEQKVNIADRVTEVKATSLIRELIRSNDLVEVSEPSKELLAEYAEKDEAIAKAKALLPKEGAKTVDSRLKEATAKVTTTSAELAEATGLVEGLSAELVEAKAKIADLEEQLTKVGDPKSKEALIKAKADAVKPKKETTVGAR